MKTFTQLVLFVTLVLFAGCRGEQGPPGLPGENGDLFLPVVFEIKGDFLPENDFRLSYEFPSSIEVFESDIVLVYLLWEQADVGNGEMLDVWRLLPQTIVIDEKILQYNYDHTFTDVQIFLDGDIDFNTLLPGEAFDQVFRIVVLPANFAAKKAQDIDDYNLMMKSLGINPALHKPEFSIKLD